MKGLTCSRCGQLEGITRVGDGSGAPENKERRKGRGGVCGRGGGTQVRGVIGREEAAEEARRVQHGNCTGCL